MKVREPGPRFRPVSNAEHERIQLMQETLESPGWRYILDVILVDVANTRKRIFSTEDQAVLAQELKTLKTMKASLNRVYSEVGYSLPDKVSALFQ